jgi:hypothetical protein
LSHIEGHTAHDGRGVPALRDPIEGGKMELVGGRVITTSPVGLRHGQVAGEVYDALKAHVRLGKLGLVTQETFSLPLTDIVGD